VDFAIVGKLAQTDFPGGDAIPFEPNLSFQFLDTEVGHSDGFPFAETLVTPLLLRPMLNGCFSLYFVGTLQCRGFAIVGKLAQTDFPWEALDCRPNSFDGGFGVDAFFRMCS
jgi:hypothetical protein